MGDLPSRESGLFERQGGLFVIVVYHGLKDLGRVLQHGTVPLEAIAVDGICNV